MKQHTEVTNRILSSPEGQKIIDMVSPVYSDGEVAVSLFQAIGLQLDDLAKWTGEFKQQTTGCCATWTLDFWEWEYGIPRDSTLTTAQRQQRLISTMQYRAPMNPKRVEQIASSATGGLDVSITERTGKNQFQVWLTALPSDEYTRKTRVAVDRVKPAHLVYDVKYVQYSEGPQYFAGTMQLTKIYEIRQVV